MSVASVSGTVFAHGGESEKSMSRTVKDLRGIVIHPHDEQELTKQAIDDLRRKLAAYDEVDDMDPYEFRRHAAKLRQPDPEPDYISLMGDLSAMIGPPVTTRNPDGTVSHYWDRTIDRTMLQESLRRSDERAAQMFAVDIDPNDYPYPVPGIGVALWEITKTLGRIIRAAIRESRR